MKNHSSALFVIKTFAQKSHLTEHLRRHSDEKPFMCKVCDTSFLRKGDLTNHQQIHNDERPIK